VVLGRPSICVRPAGAATLTKRKRLLYSIFRFDAKLNKYLVLTVRCVLVELGFNFEQ